MKNTVLLGNSFNQCENKDKSWKEILKIIRDKNNIDIDNSLITSSKYTLIYESLLSLNKSIDNFKKKEREVKQTIADELSSLKISPLYYELLKVDNIQNILTTNYDNCIEKALLNKEYTVENIDDTETKYSLRRKIKYSHNIHQEKNKTVWNIHGSIKKTDTIMLGHDHYCSYIGNINQYTEGNYSFKKHKKDIKTKSIEEKLTTEKHHKYDGISWVELFLIPIYIL
ncbi:SIR2 family protein [Campylobacter sp. RM16188]|uniref:SIR2 family protein n=1 Tax=Campylobacter sp. RM16188 TaxID=1705725 RepID=UPI00155613F7|nr:SIR2 family protein [Campylobacter sp. RM16188]